MGASGCQPASEGGAGEEAQAEQEEAAVPGDVGEGVGADDPLQPLRGEDELAPDAWQGDRRHLEVEDGEELRRAEQRQRGPRPGRSRGGFTYLTWKPSNAGKVHIVYCHSPLWW